MLKAIKKLLERNAYLISFTLTVVIVYLSLSSLTEINIQIKVSDKILHSFAYFIFTLSWFFAIKSSHSSKRLKIITAISIVLFGCILEILQENLTENRMMDPLDILANSIGIILAFFSFDRLLKVYKMI